VTRGGSNDPVGWRQGERREERAAAGAGPRAVGEKIRHVRPERGGEVVQLVAWQWLVERLVRESQGGGGVGAAAAEARGDRDLLVDAHAPVPLACGVRGETPQGVADERVAREA